MLPLCMQQQQENNGSMVWNQYDVVKLYAALARMFSAEIWLGTFSKPANADNGHYG